MLLSEKIVQGAFDLVLTTVWCQNNKLEGKTFIFDAHWKKRCTKWGIGTFLHCCTISKAKKIYEHQVSYNSVAIVEKMSYVYKNIFNQIQLFELDLTLDLIMFFMFPQIDKRLLVLDLYFLNGIALPSSFRTMIKTGHKITIFQAGIDLNFDPLGIKVATS